MVDYNEYNSIDDFLNSPIEEYRAKHEPDDDNYDLDDTLDSLESSVNEYTEDMVSHSSDIDDTTLDDLLMNANYEDDDNLLEDYIMNNNIENEENKDEDEDLTQSDLFNLIDSMYEKGEDE